MEEKESPETALAFYNTILETDSSNAVSCLAMNSSVALSIYDT